MPVLDSKTEDRKIVFQKITQMQIPAYGSNAGINVSGLFFYCRSGDVTINLQVGDEPHGLTASYLNNGVAETIISLVPQSSGQAFIDNNTLKNELIGDINPNNFVEVGNSTNSVATTPATGSEILNYLTTSESASPQKGYIFFDAAFYYFRNLSFSPFQNNNSTLLANNTVAQLYIRNGYNIYYYKNSLSYTAFRNAVISNSQQHNNVLHALPIRTAATSAVYGADPEGFHINGDAEGDYCDYDISNNFVSGNNNTGVVFNKTKNLTVTTANIAINNTYSFIDLTGTFVLKLDTNLQYGFPLFRYMPPATTNNESTTVPCLLKGTRVLTPTGYRLIETLTTDDFITNHYNNPLAIRKISKTVVKWSENLPIDKKVFKTPGYQPTFLTGWHKIRRIDGTFLQAQDCGFDLAKKEEIINENGDYEIYHIHVDDWQNNHLVVNEGTVVESWSGIYT